jgi:16S rRNA (cytosine1402-N4)-methyltransferase
LADIFFYYGGERAAKKVARAVVEKREEEKFETVSQLTTLLEKELGFLYKRKKIHPATKVFQALRITVNDEIGHLKKVLAGGLKVLKSGGRIVVVTFHSLEDKNVKKIFRS